MNSAKSECVRPANALINTSACAWNALVVVPVFLAVDAVVVFVVVVAVRTMGWIWSAA